MTKAAAKLKDLKVAVSSFSGNTGKTMVSRHLLMPRINNPEYVPVETINAGEEEGVTFRGQQWGDLQEELMLVDSAIVDVGASNVEVFFRLLDQYRGSHEEFDYFVVPCVQESKQTQDTLATLDALIALGVPAAKIRLVFNRIMPGDTVEDSFELVIAHAKKLGITVNVNAAIEENELYQRMRYYKTDIPTLLNDGTNWRDVLKKARSEADAELTDKAIAHITMKRLAASASDNLDEVFKALALS